MPTPLRPPPGVSPGGGLGAYPGGGDSRVRKKERILTALTRMNDRDTQRAAAEDLLRMIQAGVCWAWGQAVRCGRCWPCMPWAACLLVGTDSLTWPMPW